MNFEQYYDQLWAQKKDEYQPDPAMEEAHRPAIDFMELIAELEKITKRPSD